TPPRGGRCWGEAPDAFPLAPAAAGARTARRRRAAGCRPPKIGPSEQKSRRTGLLIANGYLPGETVGGIRVRCSAPPPACGNARSRCQPICGVARSLLRRLRPSVVANRGLAILAESSEPATITPRATRLTPMMKVLIIVVFYSSFVRRVPPLVRHVPGPVQTSLVRGVWLNPCCAPEASTARRRSAHSPVSKFEHHGQGEALQATPSRRGGAHDDGRSDRGRAHRPRHRHGLRAAG